MENSKTKKLILVLGFLAIVILIGFLIWNFFFKAIISPETEPTGSATGTGSGLPISPEGPGQIIDDQETNPIEGSPDNPQINPQPTDEEINQPISPIALGGRTETQTIVSAPTISPTVSQDGSSIQFYNKSDGKFYIVNENGDLIPLSNKVFYNVEKIDWAPNKTKAILEYPDGNKIVYDFNSEKQITLPKHWEDFSFSPDSTKLINKSLGIDPDNRWLIISNSDGSQSKAIEFIGTNDKDVISSWSPNNQIVAMYTRGVDFNRREVFFVGQNKENFKSTVVEGWGFEGQWSEKGDKLLYSVYSPKDDLNPKLWIVNAQGDDIGVNRKDLGIQTWSEKCAFANSSEVYCAVPKNLPKGSGLYPELALRTSDDLYKINILTGQKELIAVPDNAYNISSLIISSNEKYIYFTDFTTGQIHKIQLQQ